jgi:hypothetical protein
MGKPLDHPTLERPHRVYFALTNHCNRACPWCSTCSSPRGNTWLSLADYVAHLPKQGLFQVQLEGGEPTVHPHCFEFVRIAREHPRCTHLVLCTNGVVLPRKAEQLRAWLRRLGAPLTVKLSVNHHLLEKDPGHLGLAVLVRDVMQELGGERLLVINVRLRRGVADDDRAVTEALAASGLLPHANVFFLQRYGFASSEDGWDAPAPCWSNFTLVNPDGARYGANLLARSEGMRMLP